MNKNFGKTLIMVIDMQNVYSTGQIWECKNFNNVCRNIKKLLVNVNGEQIAFTRYIASINPKGRWHKYNKKNEDINNNLWLNKITDELLPLSKKYDCYDKSVYSSLSADGISKIIKGKKCVVITGVVAECCVLSTVLELIDKGIYVIYIIDAVAGINRKKEKAVMEILYGLSPLHLQFMTTNEYIKSRK